MESFRESHAAGPIPMPMYRRMMREILSWVLQRNGIQVLVAADIEDTGHLFGYVVTETGCTNRRTGEPIPVVHYAFIKQPFRRFGIASKLLAAAGVDVKEAFYFTFKVALLSKLKKFAPMAEWAPLLARFPKKTNAGTNDKAQSSSVPD